MTGDEGWMTMTGADTIIADNDHHRFPDRVIQRKYIHVPIEDPLELVHPGDGQTAGPALLPGTPGALVVHPPTTTAAVLPKHPHGVTIAPLPDVEKGAMSGVLALLCPQALEESMTIVRDKRDSLLCLATRVPWKKTELNVLQRWLRRMKLGWR